MAALDIVVITTTARASCEKCPHMLDGRERARSAASFCGGRHRDVGGGMCTKRVAEHRREGYEVGEKEMVFVI